MGKEDKQMDEQTRKDIQFLLFMFESYIEDTTSIEAWNDIKFKEIANRYEFNKDNLHVGLEDLCC
jgi:hypothetical protein